VEELILTKNENKGQLIWNFLKKDIVFTISFLLAIGSCLIHVPKLEYINFKVLVSLLNLMITIKAFEELKLLDKIAIAILNKCNNSKSVSAILILLCFISSMLVTNDVALITFVPLTLIISKKANINMTETIILQTVAANIGSSLTPMGNPQNLYLFSFYGLKPIQFFGSVLFLALIGIGVLCLFYYRLKNKEIKVGLSEIPVKNRKKALSWGIIFFLIIASVFGILSYKIAFIITIIFVFVSDRKLVLKIDYILLLTFICFFIFIGNFSNIDFVQNLAATSLKNTTSVYFNSILLSQFISNVPASILLSHFTSEWKPLLLGVNIGGLGTIIASLASVISYKLFLQTNPQHSKTYLKKFSIYNFSFLIFLSLVQYFLLRYMK
jgi:Na+/H+ antiporter NhaD/arsenite permease-like protein